MRIIITHAPISTGIEQGSKTETELGCGKGIQTKTESGRETETETEIGIETEIVRAIEIGADETGETTLPGITDQTGGYPLHLTSCQGLSSLVVLVCLQYGGKNMGLNMLVSYNEVKSGEGSA